MNKFNQLSKYESPIFEILEINVECGFATSGNTEDFGFQEGEW